MDYLGDETYPDPSTSTSQPSNPHPPPTTSTTITAPPHEPSDPQTPAAQTSNPSNPEPALRQFSPTTVDYTPNPSDPYNGMPPPPETTYPDLPTLMRACQDHGRLHGYACVTSSNNYKRGIAYVRCDRGGEYVNHWNVTPETRVRKNRTRRLVGCKWKARAKRVADGGWQLTMMESVHNGHGPSGDLSQHPSLRQLPEEAIAEARASFEAGATPKEVLERLKGWNAVVTPQDVYNLKAKISRKESAEAKGKPVRGARLRGSGIVAGGGAVDANGSPAVGGVVNGNGMVGMQDEGESIVDPALRDHAAGLTGIATLTAAVAQMQEAAAAATSEEEGDHAEKKCDCKCCDH